MKLLAEELQIAEGFLPVDLAGASGGVGDWVSLKNYRHLTVVFFGAPGAAAEPATITVEQAQDVSGTGVKDLEFTTYYKKQAATNLQGTGQFTKVTQAAANTAVLGSGADGDKASLVLIEFNAEDLDVEGGFDCVKVSVADVGTTAQLGAALYILSGPRYTPPPSALAN